MKRILIFSTAYHPFVGGAEVAVKEITDRLGDVAFDMITVNLDGKQLRVEKIGNVTIYRIGKGTIGKFLLPIAGVRKALVLNKKHRYNAIWAIMASQAGIAASLFRKAEPGIPMLLTVQEGDEESYLKRYALGNEWLFKTFIQPWHKLVFTSADKTTAISTYLAERAKASGSRGEVDVIPNGVDISLFTFTPHQNVVDQVKKFVNLQEKDLVLVTTSRLVEKNNIGLVIQALVDLPVFVKFLIVGVGPLEKQLKEQVKNLNLEGRVFFAGKVDYKHIPAYLAASDIFIRPSLSEGMGNSFVEAMVAKVPVIATAVGGITDFVKDRETGVFCNPHDAQSVVHAVELLMKDEKLKKYIIERAFELATAKYSWDLIAERMKNEIFGKV